MRSRSGEEVLHGSLHGQLIAQSELSLVDHRGPWFT
jgi:hypothetical protein